MPSIVNGLNFNMALAPQTAEGTPAASYLFDMPIWSGNLMPIEDVQPFAVSNNLNVVPGYYTKMGSWGGTVVVGAMPSSAGLIYALLMGTDTPSGALPTILHTISHAEPNPLWCTCWIKRPTVSPATITDRFEDGTVTGVELIHTAGQPLQFSLDMMGKTVTTAATYPSAFSNTSPNVAGLVETYSDRPAVQTFTAVTAACSGSVATFTKAAHTVRAGDLITVSGMSVAGYNGTWYVTSVTGSTFLAANPAASLGAGTGGTVSTNSFLSAIGTTSTMLMDAAATPAASAVTNVISASIKITRATQLDQTGELTPRYRTQSLYTLAFSATVEMDAQAAFNYYRTSYFGSATGTTLSPITVEGSLDWKFVEAPTAGGNFMQLQIPAVVYTMQPHAFDPAAGPVRFTITGQVAQPPTGGVFIPKITNGIVSYPTS